MGRDDETRKRGDGRKGVPGSRQPDRDGPPPGSQESEGFLAHLFRPLRKHRVTLTCPGKAVVPARKGTKKKAAPGRTPKPPAGKGKGATKTAPAPPTTAHDRQVRELQTLVRIGRQDPRRLAGIISRMLLDAREQEERAKLKFERMVWDRAERKGRKQKPEEGPKREDGRKG